MHMPSETTGLLAPPEQGCHPELASERPATAVAARHQPGAAWITQALVEDTRRHWSPRYGYELSDAEAVEILMNVKRLAQVLMRIGGQKT
jgi:hypothetical protein